MGNSLTPNNDLLPYTFDSTTAFSVGITVGASPLTLSDLTLRLAAGNNPVVATVQLRTDPDVAGTTLGSQNVSGNAVQNYLFNLAPVQLNAGGTYWLTINTNLTGNNDGLILAANDNWQAPGGSALATYAGLRSGPSNGASGVLPGAPAPTLILNGITAVPEPTSVGAVGLISLIAVQRFRRKLATA